MMRPEWPSAARLLNPRNPSRPPAVAAPPAATAPAVAAEEVQRGFTSDHLGL